MARLYKMALYVCDIEDDLSLDEIKTLIKQDALDSIAVNCICHFADEQTGPQVEWDDDDERNPIYDDCHNFEDHYAMRENANEEFFNLFCENFGRFWD